VSGPGKGADRAAWEAAAAILRDEAVDASSRTERLLVLASRSKAARRGVATAIAADSAVLAALARRADIEEESLSGVKEAERLLRRAARRDVDARRRRNPIPRNEAFRCEHCDHDVPPASGGGVRNHCPRCLRSKHVDGEVPGDRASGCGGTMDPVSWSAAGGVSSVLLRCRRCGLERPNRLRFDWPVEPDSDAVLRSLASIQT
jgi:hypothetical protein